MNDLRLPPFRIQHAAYVTRDLELGMRRLTAMFGVGEFTVYPEMDIKVPDGVAKIVFALGTVNGTPFEVIEPRGGQDGVYCQALPNNSDDIRLHHYGSTIRSEWEWRMVLEAIDSHNIDTPVRNLDPLPGRSRAVYLDTRDQLGHMIEFIWSKWWESPAGGATQQ